jgi:regulatory protein
MAYGKRDRKPDAPLDATQMRALALHYAGRYATTKGKLTRYLERKVRERGWGDDRPPDFYGLAEDFAARGYVDDAGFAERRAASLQSRGYGSQRIRANLRASGISEDMAANAAAMPDDARLVAAIVFARKRRIGPFFSGEPDAKARQRAFAALIRAGHEYEIAAKLLAMDRDAAETALS